MYDESMGSIETAARKKRKKRKLKTGLLLAALGAGILLTAAMAPNALQLLRYIPGKRDARFLYQNKRALTRLKEKGLVTFVKCEDRWYARTTNKGRVFLLGDGLRDHLFRSKDKRWDGQWRVVTFDVPEKRRSTRDRLRGYMHAYGFKKLQSSVWVFPHDCEEVLALIKAELRIGNAVLYMAVDEIENDRHLREHFHLPIK
jgi:hypothetical protein